MCSWHQSAYRICHFEIPYLSILPELVSAALYFRPMALVRRIWRESGPRGFYAGYSAALSKHVIGFACFLGTYELCRDYFTKPGHHKDEIGNAF